MHPVLLYWILEGKATSIEVNMIKGWSDPPFCLFFDFNYINGSVQENVDKFISGAICVC